MATQADIEKAFRQSIGRSPTTEEVNYYSSFPDAGKIEGDIRYRNDSAGGLNGGVPSFYYDYSGEAEKAYGELGTYYDRILKESKGDLNLALSRLVEDYDRGLRFKKQDLATNQETLAQQGAEANRRQAITQQNAEGNAIARGIYQKSQFTPDQPGANYGVADQLFANANAPYTYAANQRARQGQSLLDTFSRYKETAGVNKARTEYDLPEKERRYEYDLEQRRRKESAELANTRGQKAYQDYLAKTNAF